MKLTIEVRTESLGLKRYRVVALRPDGTDYFCFGGFYSSSKAQQKAEDYLRTIRAINPNVGIQWSQPGIEKPGEILYSAIVLAAEDSESELGL